MIKKKININSKPSLKIMQILHNAGGSARLVGGFVRDALLDQKANDIDICTDFLPEQVMKILGNAGIKTIPTGIKFGSVTAVIRGHHFEITTLRKDINCDGRHAKVSYSKNFKEDAKRRDFTINALSYCIKEHKIYDYFSGLEDLKNGVVKFIGAPDLRIQEDHLRILRFFRFTCRYAKEIDQEGLKACALAKSSLQKISKERILLELDSLLPLSGSASALNLMQEKGILQEILPVKRISVDYLKRAPSVVGLFNISLEGTQYIDLLYASLFTADRAPINKKLLMDLRLSRARSKFIMALLDLKQIRKKEEIIIHLKRKWFQQDHFSYFCAFAYVLNNNREYANLYKKLAEKKPPKFPIASKELIKRGIEGKELGKTLEKLKDKWIKSDFKIIKQELLEII